jgi:hypothetical protein
MSGVLIAVLALAAVVVFFVVVLTVGLARSAAQSDHIERRALLDWARRKGRRRRAA